jgi:hypothetical protein
MMKNLETVGVHHGTMPQKYRGFNIGTVITKCIMDDLILPNLYDYITWPVVIESAADEYSALLNKKYTFDYEEDNDLANKYGLIKQNIKRLKAVVNKFGALRFDLCAK